jgi:D-3-phosphoglycerate dehydrogenase
MLRPKVFVSWPSYSVEDRDTGQRLLDAGYEVLLRPRTLSRTEDELIGMMEGAVAAIASADPFTSKAIASNPNLKVIARVGVGLDSVDVEAATRLGVLVTTPAGLNAETVADHTLAFMLGLVRNILPHHAAVTVGKWERFGPLTPSELPGKTIGLIGAGTIGRAVARRLAGFDVKIIFYDRYVDGLEGARKVGTIQELCSVSDFISIHTPLTPETKHIIDAAVIARMKPSAFLVNTARGPLVDQNALFAALKEGRIAGAALDVFEDEPPKAGSAMNRPSA